jgi:tripartite-type tricarboxylate transporter receptor subunit TctC
MLKKKAIATAVFFLSLWAGAQDKVYTLGDPQSRILSDSLMPERVMIARAGGDGVILLNAFLNDTKTVSIQNVSTSHILPLVAGIDYPRNAVLVAQLTNSKMYLVANRNLKLRSIQYLRGTKYNIASVGQNGICAHVLPATAKQNEFDYVHIPYKTPQQMRVDLLGGHIEIACVGGALANDIIKNNEADVIVDLTDLQNFKIKTYVFVNKDMSGNDRDRLVKSLQSQLTDQKKITIENFGLTLDVLFEQEARNAFEKDRQFFQSLIQNGVYK